ncbi:MAG: FtsX-like permease family protein, partial [Longimicrobiales bacterium]
ALVLLIGAGLLLRSWLALVSTELGFEAEDRVAIQAFIWDRNPTEEQRVQRASQILARFEATPGVEAAALVSALPFHPHAIWIESPIAVQRRGTPVDEMQDVYATVATGDYFRVAGIPLIAGRTFDGRDRTGAPFVTVINESLARRFFPGEDPVGQRLDISVFTGDGRELVAHEIVGVVGDVRPNGFTSEPRPELWASFAQWGTGSLTFVAHVSDDAAAMVSTLREQVWAVDPGQSVYHAASVESLVADTVAARRFNLLLLGVFSLVALALAAIGLYGLISYSTSQRTSEIGVRMALGAEHRQIVRMIVRDGLKLALPGVALGVIGAALLSRLLAGMLYGVEPTDPATFAQLALLVFAVAALAAWIPARRAVARDPVGALREG